MDIFFIYVFQVFSVNFCFVFDIVKGGFSGLVRKGVVLVIYYDFQQEIWRGDFGSVFVEVVVVYVWNKFYKLVFVIKVDINYVQLVWDLGKVVVESGEQYFIDMIFIVIYGMVG